MIDRFTSVKNQHCIRHITLEHFLTFSFVTMPNTESFLGGSRPKLFYKKDVLKSFSKILENTCDGVFFFWSLCPQFFTKFLFFTKWQPFRNYERCFLFHLKSSFRAQDIPIFVFRSSPLFLLVSHCFRGWSKINFKVYGIIKCLNQNLIKHFVRYLRKEKRYGIETLSINRVLNKEHFHEKTHDIINYSSSICPFVFGKCGKEGKKSQKIEYLKNEKSFLDKIKSTFYSFWRAIIWWKNKNLIKISGHKL